MTTPATVGLILRSMTVDFFAGLKFTVENGVLHTGQLLCRGTSIDAAAGNSILLYFVLKLVEKTPQFIENVDRGILAQQYC